MHKYMNKMINKSITQAEKIAGEKLSTDPDDCYAQLITDIDIFRTQKFTGQNVYSIFSESDLRKCNKSSFHYIRKIDIYSKNYWKKFTPYYYSCKKYDIVYAGSIKKERMKYIKKYILENPKAALLCNFETIDEKLLNTTRYDRRHWKCTFVDFIPREDIMSFYNNSKNVLFVQEKEYNNVITPRTWEMMYTTANVIFAGNKNTLTETLLKKAIRNKRNNKINTVKIIAKGKYGDIHIFYNSINDHGDAVHAEYNLFNKFPVHGKYDIIIDRYPCYTCAKLLNFLYKKNVIKSLTIIRRINEVPITGATKIINKMKNVIVINGK